MKSAQVLSEGLEQDYYIKKTTDTEVKELLLRGHYLGAWPFAGSQYKDYTYGIYLRRNSQQMSLLPRLSGDEREPKSISEDVLVGCIVYGFPEFHASSYVSKWIRTLLSPEETIDSIYQSLRNVIEKDKEEELKAKQRGYEYKSKAKVLIYHILHATNVQDKQILELKRLYILPKFDLKNIESFAIGKGNKAIFDNNPNIQVIVSFSDSKVGHVGGVYQATNAIYAGINKSKLHRYLYLRESLAATIKRYQPEYDELVYKYPKKGDKIIHPRGKAGTPTEYDRMDLQKRERIVVRYLRSQLPQIQDARLKDAILRVLDAMEKSPQKTFTFKEVKEMLKEQLSLL